MTFNVEVAIFTRIPVQAVDKAAAESLVRDSFLPALAHLPVLDVNIDAQEPSFDEVLQDLLIEQQSAQAVDELSTEDAGRALQVAVSKKVAELGL